MRLFVCIECAELETTLEEVQQLFEDASGLRYTDPAQAHLTLKFLGEADPERVPELREALVEVVDETGVGPFDLTAGGLGVFPDIEYIQVLWLGIEEGTSELTTLHRAIEARMTALGFEPEEHDFTPHITLARMDHGGGKEYVQNQLRAHNPTADSIQVEHVTLMESRLTSDGPVYSPVERFEL